LSDTRTNLAAFAIPTAPICVPATGLITPAWYRLITALVARTGGTKGRITPTNTPDQVASLLGAMDDVEEQTAQGFFLFEEVQNAAAIGSSMVLPQDAVESANTALVFLPEEYFKQQDFFIPADEHITPPSFFFPAEEQTPSSPALFLPAEDPPPLPESITPGASPFSFSSLGNGFALIADGTVTSVTWSRDGVTFFPTGQIAGFFPLSENDSLVITYSVVPTLTFVWR